MRRGRPAGLVDTQHGEDKSDCVVVGVSSRWNAAADETANPLSPTVHTESPKLADRLTAAGAVRPAGSTVTVSGRATESEKTRTATAGGSNRSIAGTRPRASRFRR